MADRNDASAACLLDLHARRLGGERAALDLMWEEMWHPLCRRLRWQFSRASTDLVADVATDAIRAYGERPQAFNLAQHVPLDVFVYGIAWRMLRDRLRADGRRSERERAAASVLHANQQSGDRILMRVLVREIRSVLPLVCTPTELAAIMSWLDDERGHPRGAGHRRQHPADTDQRLVKKRLLARTIKRLQRLFKVPQGGGGKRPKRGTEKK